MKGVEREMSQKLLFLFQSLRFSTQLFIGCPFILFSAIRDPPPPLVPLSIVQQYRDNPLRFSLFLWMGSCCRATSNIRVTEDRSGACSDMDGKTTLLLSWVNTTWEGRVVHFLIVGSIAYTFIGPVQYLPHSRSARTVQCAVMP